MISWPEGFCTKSKMSSNSLHTLLSFLNLKTQRAINMKLNTLHYSIITTPVFINKISFKVSVCNKTYFKKFLINIYTIWRGTGTLRSPTLITFNSNWHTFYCVSILVNCLLVNKLLFSKDVSIWATVFL